MIDSTSVMIRMGNMSGRVTYQNRASLPAPSIAVASYNSCGIVCKPASSVMAKNGIPRHVLTRMTEKSARFGSTSQGKPVSLKPRFTRIQFRTLKFGAKIHIQASVPSTARRSTATGSPTHGLSKAELSLINSATPKPPTSFSTPAPGGIDQRVAQRLQ